MELGAKRIGITGGTGFLGKHLHAELNSRFPGNASNIAAVGSKDFDLTDITDVRRFYSELKPQVVFHLAAEVGGIGANRANPGRFFYANAIMGVHLIEEGRKAGIEKFVQVGTVCAYPKHTPVPFRETELWNGFPEETNAPYGIAKKALLTMCQAYRDQYGMNCIYLLPVNLYGPGDNFDLATGHVIPALIRKCVEARITGPREVDVWGTGEASREFLYVKDCAKALVLAAGRYSGRDPVNLGPGGDEIKIRDLARLIAEVVGFKGHFIWHSEKPDGQPRRSLNTDLASREFEFNAETGLNKGLEETVRWYEHTYWRSTSAFGSHA